nr:DEAD/DEAH box helicase family protein [Streptomyces sp. DHE17-7]
MSSLRGENAAFPSTTDVGELIDWVRPFDTVTVFATYASLGLGTLERAHQGGLPGWDLIVVDEAHRTSGRLGKPWAVVHDNTRIPALRRLYMTATPRLWQLGDDEAAGAPGELVASMERRPGRAPSRRLFTLTLSEANRPDLRPSRCVRGQSPDTLAQPPAQSLGAEARSDEVRGARLAALQTALLKASSEEGFRRTLTFHHQVKEAEAFAGGLPDVAAKLRAEDPRPVTRARLATGCAADSNSRLCGAGCWRSSRGCPLDGPVSKRATWARSVPSGGRRHQELRLRVLRGRPWLDARPCPGRRSRAADAAR